MANPLKELRLAVRMTQEAFAAAIGISTPRLRQYEAGERISDASLDRIRNFALEHGWADLAAHFNRRPFAVRRVFQPPPNPTMAAGIDLHGLLDEILESGDTSAQICLENFLLITTQYLRRPK